MALFYILNLTCAFTIRPFLGFREIAVAFIAAAPIETSAQESEENECETEKTEKEVKTEMHNNLFSSFTWL